MIVMVTQWKPRLLPFVTRLSGGEAYRRFMMIVIFIMRAGAGKPVVGLKEE